MGNTKAYLVQMAITLTVNMCSMAYGAWVSWPSAVINPLLTGNLGYNATKDQISTMIALLDLGNLVTPVPTSYLINIFGRKALIHCTSVIFIISSALAIISTNIWHLYAARFFAGLGRGMIFFSAPLFGAEIASIKIRGAIGIVPSMMVAFGVSFSYIFGILLPYKAYNAVILTLPAILGVACFFVPETAYFLTMKKKEDKALKTLKFYRSTTKDEKVKEEIELIRKTINKDMENKATFLDVISTKARKRALLIVGMTMFLSRMAGIIPLIAYSSTLILPESGGGLSRDAYVVINSFGLIFAHTFGMVLVETLGRRKLLLVSSAFCALITAVFAVFYRCRSSGLDVTEYNWVPYACLLLFGLIWGTGFCTVPHVLIGELFSMDVKSYAGCLISITYGVGNFVTVKLFGELEANYGIEYAFYQFSFICLVCFIFTAKYVFETKGKTFLEIQEILNNKCEIKKTSNEDSNIPNGVETIK